MAKSNAQPIYKITIFDSGFTTLKGTIHAIAPGKAITYWYKKPRSSKFALKTVAWKDLISYSGEQGKEGTITYKNPKAIVKVVKGTVSLDEKGDLAFIVTEDNENFYVKPEYMDAVADDDIEAPTFGTKKAKKTTEEEPAKKVKKKAA